ncbi:MAG TPA: methyltransferase domain-containing protein [Vicinamibacterales bacterium]|nr:methyltransferase domain-containing protein [Vicinamibacterales bacterium]
MKPAERQHVVDRYAERLGRLGPVVQALGWRDETQQELRFKVMADGLTHLEGASVLDIGCGFGDFFGYLRGRGHALRYVGCDLSPDVLEVARGRHPGVTFEVRDVLAQPFPAGSFDYVCMSGIFNHRLSDNEGFLRQMLGTAFATCAAGAAANMTTSYVDYEDPHLYYFSPEDVFRHCQTLTRRVALRHEYPLYEFTVFLYRDDPS